MPTVVEQLELAQRSYDRIYFRPNAGNAGDSLINVGFYALAETVGLEYTEINDDFDYAALGPRDLVILSGGGNIVPYWHGGSDLIRRLTQYSFPLLLMPQSVEGREEILSLLRRGDILFLRERYSFDHARALGLACELALDHDLAFAVKPELLAAPLKAPQRSIRTTRKMLYISYHYVRSRFTKSLLALRTDRESRIGGRKRKINDISTVTKFGTRTRDLNCFSAKWLLKVLSWYDVVETDRLHVFVGCVLVGTKVILHDNAYHKIRGVFEYSVQPHPVYSALVQLREPGSRPAQPQS